MNSTPRPWIIVLSLLAIFMLGGVTGGFVQSTVNHSLVLARATRGEWAAQELEIYRERLALTDMQVESLRPSFVATNEKLKQLHLATRQQIITLIKDNNRSVRSHLTDSQQGQLDTLIEERKAVLKK